MKKKNIKKEIKIFDFYKGEEIDCWGDTEGFTFITFRGNGVTIDIPPIGQDKIFNELKKLSSEMVKCLSKK